MPCRHDDECSNDERKRREIRFLRLELLHGWGRKPFRFLFFTSFLLDGCFKIPIFYINFAYKNMLSTIICFTYIMVDWRQFT